MTARERIRAAECPGGCGKGVELGGPRNTDHFPTGNIMDVFSCTAPTDEQIIERLAGDLERLLFSLGCQLAGVEGALTAIEAKNSAIAGIERIATALSLSPEAGVEEIVEAATLTEKQRYAFYSALVKIALDPSSPAAQACLRGIAESEAEDAEARMKLSERLVAENKHVESVLQGVICQRCGTALEGYAENCTAGLQESCPGFEAIEKAKAEFAVLRRPR